MKKPARDGNGKLWFMYYRSKDATVMEIRKGKHCTIFKIYDDGNLEVTLAETVG